MATYVYETIPRQPGTKARRFEVQQSMNDAPLVKHPETSEPVRRIISGGYGIITQKTPPAPPPCGGQCTCQGMN